MPPVSYLLITFLSFNLEVGESIQEAGSDWVEIIEPRTRERMYVNLVTGECGWDPPQHVRVRQSSENQWWELFDQNNNRFYYYNALTKQTVWHRPQNCDVVPLARLQAMKRNSQSDSRSQPTGEGAQIRNNQNAEGRALSAQLPVMQGTEKGSEAAGIVQDQQDSMDRKEYGRTNSTWQPAPGTKASMLVKVDSGMSSVSSHGSIPQQQNSPSVAGQKPNSTKTSGQLQVQQAGCFQHGGKASNPLESKPSLHLKKTENGGFCLVLTNGPPHQTPQKAQPGQTQPLSPKCASAAPIYDEPPIESPIYDEPPMEVEPEGVSRSKVTAQKVAGQASQKGPTKLLQNSALHPQAVNKHSRKPSNTEYSPAGREYIKQMVNIDPSSKQSSSPNGTCDSSGRIHSGPLVAKDSCKQQWKILDMSSLKSNEVHSRQSSMQSQEYPTSVISHQDSGYSTGPSPSLRRRKGRRTMVGQARPGSLGSSSELNILNEKLIAEMRAVVGRAAEIRGSQASLNADIAESCILADIHKIRLQSEGRHLRQYANHSSKDNIAASNRSLHKLGSDIRASVDSELSTRQEVVRQKRTFEKVDFSSNSLERSITSQISLSLPSPVRNTPQIQNAGSNPKLNSGGQTCNVGYHFPYTTLRKPLPEKSMEDWAAKHLNMHTRGIFRRRLSIANMLSWVGGSIKKPMLVTSDRIIKKDACELFKLVQMYMGDRQTRMERVPIALMIVTKCWTMQGIRDELYIQLCRQTTDNLCYQSLAYGWELMAICLAFFSPSPKFQSYLEGYIYRHTDPAHDVKITQRINELLEMKNKKFSKSRKKRKQNIEEEEDLLISTYAKYCYRKLQKVAVTGGKKGLRKPTIEEIHHAKNAILTPSMFGSSLEEIMERQRERYPEKKLPWVQTHLSNKVLGLGGAQVEGIFRVPGDIDEVNALKLQVDQWRIPDNLADPHIPASLLKLWYRELEEPLIPQKFYPQCVNNYENPEAAVAVVASLPEINRLVLGYLIHFLQIFAQPVNVSKTKMDVNNLAMVMAPNCLRCQSDDPRVIFENTRKEMSFIRLLIVHLDTSFIKGDL
ncbi:rho GTPase-activating protein 39 isoform X2 [Pristis pectinata]|uniref:rho GTPase-activating protein 39 isoform X2 n=1 Tax=Pristis pectinata TaxID=685728 RepID=UPI00223DEC3D|nr:rho GTPase-activating protein 39 isoform X2 [Pristis pectinata]